jgi:proline dehydrogenase
VDGETRIKEILEEFDPTHTGYIDYITWALMLSPRDLPKIIKSCSSAGRLSQACPTDEEIELLDAMFDRGRLLGEEAARTGTRLLIDAEQYRYQPAIDNLVLELQQKFNAADVAGKPIIYNTYQCYRKDTPERLRIDVDRSERFNYHFGAKLVRGAYMESERKLARTIGVPDPIHDNIDDTHACYNESVDYLLGHSIKSDKKVELMCATHNQTSIEKAIESMDRHGIDRKDSTICFGQLYGMSDHLTFNLGSHGYRAFKYVPYGEVNEAIEYLLRRARENSSVVGGAQLELDMIKRELRRRLHGGI